MGPINRHGFCSHSLNLDNTPGKNKTQAMLSKVTWPNDTAMQKLYN